MNCVTAMYIIASLYYVSPNQSFTIDMVLYSNTLCQTRVWVASDVLTIEDMAQDTTVVQSGTLVRMQARVKNGVPRGVYSIRAYEEAREIGYASIEVVDATQYSYTNYLPLIEQ